MQNDRGGDVLTQARMRDRKSASLVNLRMLQQRLFDLVWRDFLPTTIDDFLRPTDDR
jgi:hypothetical protein